MDQVGSLDDQIGYNIKKLQSQMQPLRKGGKRATVQFKDDIDRMADLKSRQKKVKCPKSKRAFMRDNPTEKQARLRKDWPMFEQAIKDELHQIRSE